MDKMTEYEPFKTGNIWKMRHKDLWSTWLLNDELMAQVEPGALAQARNVMEMPGVSRVTFTPDVHFGYGFPIGTTVESDTHLYPDVVGPDPACSVALSYLHGFELEVLDKPAKRDVLNAILRRVSVGDRKGNNNAQSLTKELLYDVLMGAAVPVESWAPGTLIQVLISARVQTAMRELYDDLVTDLMLSQTGSIGGGNHFLELGLSDKGTPYVLTHFGSRGIGAAMANWFDVKIRTQMELWGVPVRNGLTYVPVDTELGRMFLAYQEMMLNWAAYNHRYVHDVVHDALDSIGYPARQEFVGHIPHNFIEDRDGKLVGRKGATPAYQYKGIPMLVPGSMTTGSYVLRPGPDASKHGETVAHGAGRVLGRRAAKAALDAKTVAEQFNASGVMGNFRSVPVDESAGAYKDVDLVVDALVTTGVATVEARLNPLLVLKGD